MALDGTTLHTPPPLKMNGIEIHPLPHALNVQYSNVFMLASASEIGYT